MNRCRTVLENIYRIHHAHNEISLLVQSLSDFDGRNSLLYQLQEMKDYGFELAIIAPSYDFSSEVQGNGFRTLIEIGIQFIAYGSRELKSGNTSFLSEYVKVADNFFRIIPFVKRVQKACKRSGSLECNDPSLTAQMFHVYIRAEENFKRLFSRTAAFDTGSWGSLVFNVIFWQRAISRAPNLTCLIKCLFDRDFRDSQLLLHARKSTPASINRLARGFLPDLVLHHLYPWFINGWEPGIKWNFEIERQSEFLIQLDHNLCPQLIHSKSIGEEKKLLPCRLLQSTMEESKTLMINVHGGGLALGDKYTNDVFLRYWVRKIPSMAVLSLEYTLLPHARFPTQVQECLDVFLFFCDPSNREAIISKIGFYPEQIVVSGDSAGGLLAMSTLIVMNELRKTKMKTDFRMPSAAFLFYPWLSVHPDIRPSLFISSMTTLLHTTGFYHVMRGYIPIKDQPCVRQTCEEIKSDETDINANKTDSPSSPGSHFLSWPVISHIFRLLMYLFSTNTKIPPAPWKPYQASQPNLVEQIKSSSILSKHPFVSPLYYDDFESLRDVKLFMAPCSHDSLLDEAIIMASKWRGVVSLDVMNNLQHGFLHLIFRENSRKAVDLIIKRIQDWI